MASTCLPSKLSRAICAYLVSSGACTPLQAFPHFSTRRRNFDNGPIVTPMVLPGEPEPLATGDNRFKVHVSIKGSSSNDDTDEENDTNLIAFEELVGAVRDALMQSDDEVSLEATYKLINAAAYALPGQGDAKTQARNADMINFTLMQWTDSTYGAGQAKDCDWEIVLMFNASAAESQIQGYT